jgi:hypothetical protein
VELLADRRAHLLNLRGIKESITIIVPIFLLFVATHLAVMVGVFVTHPGTIGGHLSEIHTRSIPTRKASGSGCCW